MIFILSLAVVLSIFVIWFVTYPLFSAAYMDVFSASYKGFADEAELRQVLQLRDQLVERLVMNTSSHERVRELSDAECFQALVSLSLRLQRAELPFLPSGETAVKSDTAAKGVSSESGKATLPLLILVAAVIAAPVLFFKASAASAQAIAEPSASEGSLQGQAPAMSPLQDPAPPSLVLVEPGYFAPRSNRYMVSPAQGFAAAYHVTTFSVPSNVTGGFTLILPLPEKIYDWQLSQVKPESLAKQISVQNREGLPVLTIPSGTQGLAVEISSEFKISGSDGRAVWQNKRLPPLPGEQVVVLFETDGILRSIFGEVASDWNIWPPRLVDRGTGQSLRRKEVAMNPSLPARQVQILSRESSEPKSFVEFEIVGMVPQRTPLIVLGALVFAILFGIAVFVFVRATRWRIDSPQTLPG
ncbi:MAG: hypothetical protein RIR26_1580 [Pseudomonadota bacterium]|jgi:hypothetical protein